MKPYGEFKTGADGQIYAVRYLLTPEELAGLQKAGIVGEVSEIVGLQDAAESIVAMLERDFLAAAGVLEH